MDTYTTGFFAASVADTKQDVLVLLTDRINRSKVTWTNKRRRSFRNDAFSLICKGRDFKELAALYTSRAFSRAYSCVGVDGNRETLIERALEMYSSA